MIATRPIASAPITATRYLSDAVIRQLLSGDLMMYSLISAGRKAYPVIGSGISVMALVDARASTLPALEGQLGAIDA